MIIKKNVYDTPGNALMSITETTYKCDVCCGEGLVDINKEQLLEKMVSKTFRDSLKLYRLWKKQGKKLMCDDCEGLGVWTELS